MELILALFLAGCVQLARTEPQRRARRRERLRVNLAAHEQWMESMR